ncbi:MAG: SpoIIE family protein phosphatase [Vicinamibacterales bacterium]
MADGGGPRGGSAPVGPALIEFTPDGTIFFATGTAVALLSDPTDKVPPTNLYDAFGPAGAEVRAAVLAPPDSGTLREAPAIHVVGRDQRPLQVSVVRPAVDRLVAILTDSSTEAFEAELHARFSTAEGADAPTITVALGAELLGADLAVWRQRGASGFEVLAASDADAEVGGPGLAAACLAGRSLLAEPRLRDRPESADGPPPSIADRPMTAALAAPIVIDGEPLAALELYHLHAAGFHAVDRDRLRRVADVAAAWIHRRERALAIDRLAESESRLRTVFSSIDDGYCLCEIVLDDAGNAVDYRFLETNPLFEQMTGLAGATGRTALELVPQLERVWLETYAAVALGGRPLRFEEGSEAMRRWFQVFAVPVQPYGRFAIVFRDHTEAHRAERRLRTSEALFRTLADDIPVLVWLQGPDGEQQWVNQSFCTFFGVDRDTMRNDRWQVLVHPDDIAAYAAAYHRAVRQGASFHAEVRVRRGDGRWRWLESWAHPRHDPDGRFVGHVGASADVTERKELELHQARAVERERGISLQLQRALLPDAVVDHPDVELAVRYVAAEDLLEVGGDWYDTFRWADHHVGVAVGDVVGHGVEAAAAMGRLRAACSALAPVIGPDPAALITALDGFAAGPDGVSYLTMCVAVLDTTTGVLRYASAGHPPMLLIEPDGSHRWLDGGRSVPVAGLRPGTRPEAQVRLRPGSTVVLYSDGLIERRRERLDDGLDRITDTAGDLAVVPVEEIPGRLCDAMGGEGALEDDLVIACLRFRPRRPIDGSAPEPSVAG